jgi:predicted MPP superfamily phosphohydrolase
VVIGILIAVAIVVVVLLLIVGIVDGNRFNVVNESFTLPNLKKECRFVMISDLHNKVYGNKNDKILEAVDKINPDFVILAGDLVTSKPHEDMTPGISLINDLAKKYKVYYGLGNHESKLKWESYKFENMYEVLKTSTDKENIIRLENDAATLPEYNINITGLDLELQYFAHFRLRKMEEGYLERTLPRLDKSKCNLLIAHNPDYFENYVEWGADLVLSGHVHGGIMRLPLVGGVISPSYRIFPKYDGGIFRSGKTTMLLGRGMGSHTLPFRFFNPAELYAVTLKPLK